MKIARPSKRLKLLASALSKEAEADATDAVSFIPARDAVMEVEEEVRELYVGRNATIRAIILGLMTQQHVMLEGSPGLAKTEIANRIAKRIEDPEFVYFELQLHKGTPLEALFGPMDITALREKAVYKYNTKGKLPRAHIAVLDEIGRASDLLLPASMAILNERVFHNGNGVQQCPLMTAIATTNFFSDNPELEAYKDRWLINHRVLPLVGDKQLKKLSVRMHVSPVAPLVKAVLTLDQVRELQQQVKAVRVSHDLSDLYVDFWLAFGLTGQGSIPLTDRRFVQAISLAKANAVIYNRSSVDPDDLLALAYGMTKKGVDAEDQAFDSTYQKVIGTRAVLLQERDELDQLDAVMTALRRRFDPTLPQQKIKAIVRQIDDVLSSVPRSKFTQLESLKAYDSIQADMLQLKNTCITSLPASV